MKFRKARFGGLAALTRKAETAGEGSIEGELEFYCIATGAAKLSGAQGE